MSADTDVPRTADYTPPHDLEAEKCTLGAMLLSKSAIGDVIEMLRADDFYRPAHKTIFDTIVDMFGRGEPVDALLVFDELRVRGELGTTGGAPYLHELAASVLVTANAAHYAKIVREQAILRRLLETTTRARSRALNPSGDRAEDVVARVQEELSTVVGVRGAEDFRPIADILPEALDEMEAIGNHQGHLVGVPTGFSDLDALTNGLHPGQMIVVAARPALGKSTIGLDFARSAAIKHALTTVIFSLEMSRAEITMRLLSAEARVALHAIRAGMLSDDDWTRLAKVTPKVTEAPLFIDDSPNMSMTEIRLKAQRLKERHDLRFIIIDYLQLMSSPKKVETRQNEVSEISRQIKLLAKELEIPIVAISQLNRGPEQRTDKRPLISDLRESGSIEQDSDMVILLHREDAYVKEHPRAGEADLIVAKHRNGPTSTVTVAFQGHYSRFVDMATKY